MIISLPLRNSLVTIVGWILLTSAAMAQTQGGPPPQGDNGNGNGGDRPHGPPPEAISACQGKANGAACTFVGRRGEQLTGTCFTPPDKPAGPPDGTQGQHSMVKRADSSPRPMACRPVR